MYPTRIRLRIDFFMSIGSWTKCTGSSSSVGVQSKLESFVLHKRGAKKKKKKQNTFTLCMNIISNIFDAFWKIFRIRIDGSIGVSPSSPTIVHIHILISLGSSILKRKRKQRNPIDEVLVQSKHQQQP